VADALSRLDKYEGKEQEENLLFQNAQLFHMEEDLLPNAFPLKLKTITKYQQQDKELLEQVQKDNKNNYSLNIFCGGGKERKVICRNDKIVIPKMLQEQIVQWYHTTLCHPSETRTEQTIRQNFTWTNLRNTVHQVCSKCPTCQITKRNNVKYGKIPEKEAEAVPWEKLCVDLIGPCTIKSQNNKEKRIL
jgi:hypothetical protein